MTKLITISLVVTMVVAFGVILFDHPHHRSANQSAPNPAAQSSPSTNPNRPAPKTKLSPKLRQLVSSAVLANSSLSSAQLMVSAQIKRVVNNLVVPAKRPAMIKVYSQLGEVLAKYWGYPSRQDAQVRGDYYVLTQKYKISRHSANSASVELYNLTHFRTSHDWNYNQEHWDATITVIEMRRVDNRWLYAGAHDTPVQDMPPTAANLSFAQTKLRLQPYLRGFTSYANLG